jgi:hypothetical protein
MSDEEGEHCCRAAARRHNADDTLPPPHCRRQITLGVLFIIVQVSSLLGYFGKFDYFLLPQECSHILCAHNLFSPA